MKSSEANSIAKRINKVVEFVNLGVDTEGKLSSSKVDKVIGKLNAIVESITAINDETKHHAGNFKGRQVMNHMDAVTLNKELQKVAEGFEGLAKRMKKKKSKTIG